MYAISLIGNPIVVFLVDPEVRRLIWNIVNKTKKDRNHSTYDT